MHKFELFILASTLDLPLIYTLLIVSKFFEEISYLRYVSHEESE